MQSYYAFKLVIRSELFFPELLPLACNTDQDYDVLITFGSVDSQGIRNPLAKSLLYQVNEDSFWLTVPGVARFLISNGNSIVIDPIVGVDEDSIRLFVLGSCMGALLMQQNLITIF